MPGHPLVTVQRRQERQPRRRTFDLGERDRPVNPRTDWQDWKKLLKAAGVRDARLHDARHTAATLALLAGVLDRTAQVLFGWASASNGDRYRHVTRAVQRDAADRLEALVWSPRLALESGTDTRHVIKADEN